MFYTVIVKNGVCQLHKVDILPEVLTPKEQYFDTPIKALKWYVHATGYDARMKEAFGVPAAYEHELNHAAHQLYEKWKGMLEHTGPYPTAIIIESEEKWINKPA